MEAVPSIDHTVTLRAPAAEVFEYLTDPEKATAWQSSLVDAHFSPAGRMQLGTRITEVRKVLGRKLESTVDVTEFEPPRRFGGRVVAGPVQWEFRYTLAESEGSTTLSFDLEGDPGRFLGPAKPLVLRAMKKQLVGDFSRLKEIAEPARDRG
jgi:uncharacterized protein YndB with AHSA1/START domain